MQCPDCSGAMWDNRETKKSPKQPDYKCKNKQCDKAVWLEKKGETNGNGASNGHAPPPAVRGALAPVYGDCMEIASRAVKHYIGATATPADIIAATATLFIAATNTNRPVKAAAAPKPQPAPPPPPPRPMRIPEPEYAPLAGETDDLPF